MATGILLFAPGQRVLDTSGALVSGALLNVYVPGTTTRRNTYSDSALTTPNANPVVADSAGKFGPIYLDPSLAYKFVLTTSAGASLADQDNFYPGAVGPATTVEAAVCEGRLTLTSGTPVTTADVTGATSIYFAPYVGHRVALYDGTSWAIHTFSELTLSLAGLAANLPHDVFLYDNAGTKTLEALAWTNTTTRATAIARQDGVLVKSGATTRRYLGTFCTTGVVGQTEDSMAKRLVWNYYNRVNRPMRVTEATNTWTYTTATIRQANGSTANQIAFVIGVAEVAVLADVVAYASNSSLSDIAVGIGEDSTTAFTSGFVGGYVDLPVVNRIAQARASLRRMPAAGYHFWAWLEYSNAVGVCTWSGDANAPERLQAGLTGVLEG